jgi:hypothetical protein
MAHDAETPLRVAAEGMLSGMGGALALTALTTVGNNILMGRGLSDDVEDKPKTAGQVLSEAPTAPPNISEVTATFVQKVATGLFGTSLTTEEQYAAGVAWHLAYGGFWGALYALTSASVKVPGVVLAPIFGLSVWAIGPGWLVPKMKIMLPPHRETPRTVALMVGSHVIYAGLVSLGCYVFKRRS